jgi:hypothetical protein
MVNRDEQASRFTELLSILIGVLIRYERSEQPLSYGQLKSIMSSYCSEEELQDACRSLQRCTETLRSIGL